MCGGLEADIEGGIHFMRSLWKMNLEEDTWEFILMDTRNAFNEGNRHMISWVSRHEWPSGCRFIFNICRHHSLLATRADSAKKLLFLKSQEGCIKYYPLVMVGY